MTTSSPKSYNYLALRGAGVDDMEYVENFGLPEEVAYTPRINDEMLNMVYDQNIASGMDKAEADKTRSQAARDIRELLAKRGML